MDFHPMESPAVRVTSDYLETAHINGALHRVPTSCPGQWLYLLADEGIVYSEMQNRFAGLGAAGVSAYRAFDAGAGIEDLRRINNRRGSSPASDDGLETIHALSRGRFPAQDDVLEWPPLEYPVTASLEIHGIPVLVEHPTGPLEDFCRDYFKNCPPSTQPARCHLSVQRREDAWAIDGNGIELLSLLQDEQLGLGLLHAARSLLYADAEYDVAFHAAMVADGHCGVMLCAPREFGKSTLAAYLVAGGFELVTDEPALLHLDTCTVSSLLLPVSLKEGSWAALRQEWPQLAGAPIHVRSDGAKIRLLHPPRTSPSAPSRRLTHVVFPEYCSACTARTERLSPLRTLGLLNQGGMILAKRLVREKFEALLTFVCTTPAYIFQYDSLEQAGRMIRELSVEIE
jgi:hypothetical protein